MKFLVPIIIVALLGLTGCFIQKKGDTQAVVSQETVTEDLPSIHGLSAEPLLSDEAVALSKYDGKVMLIVNVASKCGLTPQYEDLQALHEELSGEGLAILGFPSNDFMRQEPGSEEEIASFCQKNYGVEFDMFEKVKVKGDDKHPVYQFLTEKDKNGVMDSKVSWNFQKYLLDKEGKLVAVFNPKVKVTEEEVRNEIQRLLKQ